jgi:hypothetical protein
VTILEGVIGTSLTLLVAGAALTATLAASRVVNVPPSRDHVLVAAHNAAVEARALAAYDASAAAAILSAPPATWSDGDVTLHSSVDGQTLVLVAATGAQNATVRYPVSRETLPQGAIIDTSGNILVP